MSRHTVWTDDELLMALHLRDHEGMTSPQLAVRFGRSRNSVIGALNRIRIDEAKHDAKGIGNGTLKPLWWRLKVNA